MTPRILIIDDNADIRWILSDLLESHGFHCQQAQNAMAALTMVEHTDFDVILTDYQMPNMNGLELLQQLAVSQLTSSTPVIMITAFCSETLETEARQAGAWAVLQKPINTRELLTTVTQAIENTRPHSDPCPCQ
ncbi:MAG: Fis family transcriptional regulator [Nitrospirales bacterium]|nr:MAG: Fis family transcriptional regulator [Nitrospirales bacterium]